MPNNSYVSAGELARRAIIARESERQENARRERAARERAARDLLAVLPSNSASLGDILDSALAARGEPTARDNFNSWIVEASELEAPRHIPRGERARETLEQAQERRARERAQYARNVRIENFRRQRDAVRSALEYIEYARTSVSVRNARTNMRQARAHLRAAFPNLIGRNGRIGRGAAGFSFDVPRMGDVDLWRMWGRLSPVARDTNTGENQICACCGVTHLHHSWFSFNVSGNNEATCLACLGTNSDWANREYSSEHESDDEWGGGEGLMSHMANPMQELGISALLMPKEKLTPQTRLFGFEVEYVSEPSQGLNQIIGARQRVGVHKSDGSLPGGGGEFCTLPMTRAAAYENLPPVLSAMVTNGARAWNRTCCGLHIHVSRASASWTTWGKVDRFIFNRNNQAFLDEISGRQCNSYCDRYPQDPARIKVRDAYHKFRRGSDRYQALNFATGDKPTVEFRLFRGNVAPRGVLRCMEFCDALIEFARTQSNTAPMDHAAFKTFVMCSAKAYPILARWLNGKMNPAEIENAA